jgi:hypothetical protein
MKKYAAKKQLNGVEIIAGIGEYSIDPQATKRVAQPYIEATEEFKKHAQLTVKYSAHIDAMFVINRQYKKEKNLKIKEQLSGRFKDMRSQIEGLQTAVKEAYIDLEQKMTELRAEHAVYFTPADSVEIDPETEAIFRGLKKDHFMTVEGQVLTAQELHTLRLSKMSPAERAQELKRVKMELAEEFATTIKKYELLEDEEGAEEANKEFKFRLKALEAAYV